MIDLLRRKMWHKLGKRLYQNLVDFIYPQFCLSCQEKSDFYLCPQCLQQLELLSPIGRCPYCFKWKESIHCPCLKEGGYPFAKAACFDYRGAGGVVVQALKYRNMPYLAKGLAAYLLLQFFNLKWPMPDFIVPIPQSFFHFLERGYNQSLLLAQELGNLLKRPVSQLLKSSSSGFSQTFLSKEERFIFEGKHFTLKDSSLIEDKTILLIDDVMTTGRTLSEGYLTLQEGLPQGVYALAVCQSG